MVWTRDKKGAYVDLQTLLQFLAIGPSEAARVISLVNVLEYPGISVPLLYRLMLERPPEANVHHRTPLTMENHRDYVLHHSYKAWYLIEWDGPQVGSIYLTKRSEIGYFILKQYQRRGYAEAAIRAIMAKHPLPRYLLNIGPDNVPSLRLAEKLGAKLIANTYELSGGDHDGQSEIEAARPEQAIKPARAVREIPY